MKRGRNQAETLHLNGWEIGDILEGTESNDQGWSNTSRILITRIGEEGFLCRWDYMKGAGFQEEVGNTTLNCREWKKVDEDKERKSSAGFWGRVSSNLMNKNKNLQKRFTEQVKGSNEMYRDLVKEFNDKSPDHQMFITQGGQFILQNKHVNYLHTVKYPDKEGRADEFVEDLVIELMEIGWSGDSNLYALDNIIDDMARGTFNREKFGLPFGVTFVEEPR